VITELMVGFMRVRADNRSMKQFMPLALLVVLTAPPVAAQQTAKISGTVTYHEKIALPATSVVEIRLEDVTRPDAAAPVVATVRLDHPGQVPIRFDLPYELAGIDARGRYAVRATIVEEGAVQFKSLDTVLVLTQGHGSRADLVLTHVGMPKPVVTAKPAEPKPTVPAPPKPPTVQLPPVNALPSLPATFTGSFICADCPHMQYQLNLYPDDSFFTRATVTGRGMTGTTDDMGSWTLSSDRRLLVLNGRESIDLFVIGANGELKKLEPNAKPLPGHLPNAFAHAAAFKALAADLPMRGAYSMADAPSFVECSTGQRWPVADEGAAAALEAAYLKARSAPGASVLIDLEGLATPRPRHDGAVETTLVVKKFVRALPKESCAARFSNAPLTDTYWRLTRLGDHAVPASTDAKREPSITFQATEDPAAGGYSGSSGCNRVVGTYAAAGALMTLTSGGTLMACRDQAETEAGFLTALKATRWYRIAGHTLELFDASGTRLARFEAKTSAGVTRR
jgi:copper homeostasis protein (lipoprotein)